MGHRRRSTAPADVSYAGDPPPDAPASIKPSSSRGATRQQPLQHWQLMHSSVQSMPERPHLPPSDVQAPSRPPMRLHSPPPAGPSPSSRAHAQQAHLSQAQLLSGLGAGAGGGQRSQAAQLSSTSAGSRSSALRNGTSSAPLSQSFNGLASQARAPPPPPAATPARSAGRASSRPPGTGPMHTPSSFAVSQFHPAASAARLGRQVNATGSFEQAVVGR